MRWLLDRLGMAWDWIRQVWSRYGRLTDRQQMIQAWGWVAFTRCLFFLPFWTRPADYPDALKLLVPAQFLWIVPTIWGGITALSALAMYWPPSERYWWPAIIGGMAGWGGMYLAGWALGYAHLSWSSASVWLLLARLAWVTKGDAPLPRRKVTAPREATLGDTATATRMDGV